jgi:hypothetical protein
MTWAVIAIVSGGLAVIMLTNPEWVTNHWKHWLFGPSENEKGKQK